MFRKKDALSKQGSRSITFKAHLVIRNFQQKQGVDYYKTFAPVVKFTTFCLILAVVASENPNSHQMEVNTSFLNGDLEEDSYIEQRKDFIDASSPDQVCKLKKALHRLKQASRQRFSKLDDFLVKRFGLSSCEYDKCFYVYREIEIVLLVNLYVDDLLIAGHTLCKLTYIKT